MKWQVGWGTEYNAPSSQNQDIKMSNAETLCLKWNDFQENILSAFKDLRLEKEFTDVTLACEDGKQIEAHKIVLTASSPLFKSLLKANKHQHPLVYMRGVKSDDLHAIQIYFFFSATKKIYLFLLGDEVSDLGNLCVVRRLKGIGPGFLQRL